MARDTLNTNKNEESARTRMKIFAVDNSQLQVCEAPFLGYRVKFPAYIIIALSSTTAAGGVP